MTKISTICDHVRERRRVLERMRGVGVEEAAAVRSEHLDRLLRGDGTLRDCLRRALDRPGDCVWDRNSARTPCDTSTRAATIEKGSRMYSVVRVRSTQKLPIVFDLVPGKPTDHRNRDGDPRRGRHEVLDGQRCHLHQITDRRFAAVPLPVRVRHEAEGGVERLVGCNLARAESLRVERQDALQPYDCVCKQKADEAERQNRGRRTRSTAAPRLRGRGRHGRRAPRAAEPRGEEMCVSPRTRAP